MRFCFMGRQFSRDSQSYIEARSSHANEVRHKAAVKQNVEKMVMLGLLGVSVLVFGSSFIVKGTSQNKIDSEIIPKIEQLNVELEQVKKDAERNELGHVVRYEDAIVASAAEKGMLVCDQQNRLGQLSIEARRNKARTLSEEQQSLLLEYRENVIVPDDRKYKKLKGTWCDSGDWKFDSTFDYEGTRMQVVWRCYSRRTPDKMIALCIGTYDDSTKKFSDLSLYRPSQGLEEDIIVASEIGDVQAFRTTNEYGEYDDPIELDPEDTTADTTRVPDETDPDIIETSDSTTTYADVIIVSDDPIVTLETTTTTAVVPDTYVSSYLYPEEQWFYGWSVEYQCWGYFDQDGHFMSEEEYQNAYGGW